MKLLDTNVFVYARGRPSRYQEPCRAIVGSVDEDPTAYGVDVELFQELMDVYDRRGRRRQGAMLIREILTSFPEPFPITRQEIEEAVDIVVAHARLSPRDAIHAAVCLTFELEGIVTADKAFDRVPRLIRFDPLKLARELS